MTRDSAEEGWISYLHVFDQQVWPVGVSNYECLALKSNLLNLDNCVADAAVPRISSMDALSFSSASAASLQANGTKKAYATNVQWSAVSNKAISASVIPHCLHLGIKAGLDSIMAMGTKNGNR